MPPVPFREVLEYLESFGWQFYGTRGIERVFRKGREFIRIEVHDRKVILVDFQTVKAIVEGEAGGRFGRRIRR